MTFRVEHPFEPRETRYLGLREHGNWRLKTYSISCAGGANPAGFEDGITSVLGHLPSPAVAPARPGVGVLILHAGRGCDYTVLAWWDRENELPIRIAVRDPGQPWRPSHGAESICVWDLDVLWHERSAYVARVLRRDPDVEGYLGAAMGCGVQC